LPFDYGCFIVKIHIKAKRDELKRVLRATIAAYDWRFRTRHSPNGQSANIRAQQTAKRWMQQENVKDYALRIPYVSLADLPPSSTFAPKQAPK
jgi:hypothetical protein